MPMTVDDRETRRQRNVQRRRRERAEHVLDVTAELVLRWGYRKTTMDDIAQSADVAKGTILLHWTKRDALFASLLRRERVRLLTDIRSELTTDTSQATLYGLFRQYMLEISKRPLMAAMLTGDSDLLGRLARDKHLREGPADLRTEFVNYLETLRKLRLARTDLSVHEQQAVVAATFHGFLTAPPVNPPDPWLSDQRRADLCAQTIASMLAPDHQLATVADDETSRATLDYLDRLLANAEKRYRHSLGIDQPETQ